MSEKFKLTKGEALAAITAEAELEAIDQELEAKSDEEVGQELRTLGVSPEHAEELLAKHLKILGDITPSDNLRILAPKAPSNGVTQVGPRKRIGKRNRLFAAWAGGGAIVAAVAAATLGILTASGTVTVAWNPSNVPTTSPTGALPPARAASELRALALEACEVEHWQTCLNDLDQAKHLDPREETPAIRALRKAAVEGLAAKRDGG